MRDKPSAEELAAVVRKVLTARARLANVRDEDVAALDELVALVGTLQQERDAERRWCKHWAERAEAAEAALAKLREQFSEIVRNARSEQVRANTAEAALATTRQALTEIADQKFGMATVQGDRLIARRALADTGGDTKETT